MIGPTSSSSPLIFHLDFRFQDQLPLIKINVWTSRPSSAAYVAPSFNTAYRSLSSARLYLFTLLVKLLDLSRTLPFILSLLMGIGSLNR